MVSAHGRHLAAVFTVFGVLVAGVYLATPAEGFEDGEMASYVVPSASFRVRSIIIDEDGAVVPSNWTGEGSVEFTEPPRFQLAFMPSSLAFTLDRPVVDCADEAEGGSYLCSGACPPGRSYDPIGGCARRLPPGSAALASAACTAQGCYERLPDPMMCGLGTYWDGWQCAAPSTTPCGLGYAFDFYQAECRRVVLNPLSAVALSGGCTHRVSDSEPGWRAWLRAGGWNPDAIPCTRINELWRAYQGTLEGDDPIHCPGCGNPAPPPNTQLRYEIPFRVGVEARAVASSISLNVRITPEGTSGHNAYDRSFTITQTGPQYVTGLAAFQPIPRSDNVRFDVSVTASALDLQGRTVTGYGQAYMAGNEHTLSITPFTITGEGTTLEGAPSPFSFTLRPVGGS